MVFLVLEKMNSTSRNAEPTIQDEDISRLLGRVLYMQEGIEASQVTYPDIKEEKSRELWQRTIRGYNMDCSNSRSEEEQQETYYSLLIYVSSQVGIIPTTLNKILHRGVRAESSPSYSIKSDKRRILMLVENRKDLLLPTVDESLINLAKYRQNRAHPTLLRLCLRYSFLDPTSAYFWSLPQDMYTMASRSTSLDSIECFASPFDYSHSHFCSLYAEDVDIEYRNARCVGNFFDVIDNMTRRKIVKMLLCNPPFSRSVVHRTINVLRLYLATVGDAEIIGILPSIPEAREFVEEMDIASVELVQNTFYLRGSERKVVKPYEFSILLFCKAGNITDKLLERAREMLTKRPM